MELPKHTKVRWLTLTELISRVLKMWPAIKSYFSSCGSEAHKELRKIFSEDHALIHEAYFSFLSQAMEQFRRFNVKVQVFLNVIFPIQCF